MKSLSLLTAASLACSVSVLSGDWTSWGGGDPGRNMYSAAKGLPEKFTAGDMKRGTEEIDLQTTENVRWVAKLGSQTYGNPTVADGRVFIGTNNESPRDPRHVGDRSILMCLDEKSGELLWQLVVPKLKSGKVNDWENMGMMSSPLIVGDRLYVVTSRCEVLCLDVQGMANGNTGPYKDEAKYVVLDTDQEPIEPGPKDADIIWRYDMMDELGVFPHNASNSSPLILDGRIYVCTSNGQDWTHVNVPSPESPSFIALDAETGELVGEDNAALGPRIYHGQWTSMSAGKVNDKWQILAGGGDGVLYAFDPVPSPGSGDPLVPVLGAVGGMEMEEFEDRDYLKKIWWVDINPPEYKTRNGQPIRYPAADGPNEIIATPVFYKNRVYVASGQDPEHGEGVGRLLCVDPTGAGDMTEKGILWEYRGIKRSLSTCSIDPETGLLFIADFSGFVHCLDADTGKVHWVHDMKAHIWGSTLVADGKVYVGDEDGDLAILAADKELKVLSETYMAAPIYCTPIVANGVLYVGTQTHLYAIEEGAKPVLASDRQEDGVRVTR